MSYQDELQGFLELHSLRHVVSFSGGYLKDDATKVTEVLVELFTEIQDYPIAILTGGTDWNFPGLVTRIAKQFGFKCVGVLPQSAEEDKAPGLDLAIVVPSPFGESDFGDECPVFVKASNVMVSLGGGPGAGAEIFMSMKMSSAERPIHLVPLLGFGGVTDLLATSCFNKSLKESACQTGKGAGREILRKLGYP